MSYLDSPRLHFRGWFQADVSTINNDIRFYQNTSFVPEYQGLNSNGSWNPEGTGIFRILDCAVTGGYLNGQAAAVDGITVQNASQRAPGKLVDLDPQQQMVSEIWGMQIRLVDAAGKALLESDFQPAAFINLWFRQQTGVRRDQQLAAVYQSVLENVHWGDTSGWPLLQALQAATQDGLLSINCNVYGYGRDNTIPRYTMGHIVGTIGPYFTGEPKHFVRGRQLIAQLQPNLSSATMVGMMQAKVSTDGNSITADLGNALPVVSADGPLQNIGDLSLAVLTTNPDQIQQTVTSDQIVMLGAIPYLDKGWYEQTAGVVTFDISANGVARQILPNRPLVLLSAITNTTGYKVLLQEALDGVYVRADNYVYRVDPGDTREIDFYADRFGAPMVNATIQLQQTDGFMGGSGGGATISPPARPAAAIPNINQPANVIAYPATVTTDASGHAVAKLSASASGPGNPRGYIGGQVYGIGYQLATQPANYVSNPMNYVSVLAFDKKEVPETPTWYGDIQALFTQYANLYPIMGKYVVDLSDYHAVVQRLKILRLAFSLPMEDPNHMPVTRDLSKGERGTILKWLDMKGADGLPPLGTPEQLAASAAPGVADHSATGVELLPGQAAGKTAVILNLEQRGKAAAARGKEQK